MATDHDLIVVGGGGAGLAAALTAAGEGAAGRHEQLGRGSMAWTRNNGDSRVEPNPCIRPLSWYNSGTSNGRALIFGYIGARHAIGATLAWVRG